MSTRLRVGWLLLMLGVYAGRFLSCVEALNREVRPVDEPYHSVDPHGFLLLGAFFAALVLVLPTCWLLFGGVAGPGFTAPGPDRRTTIIRAAAVVAVIGTPTLPQTFYLAALPLAASWPIIVSSVIWLGVVAAAMLHRSHRLPSGQRAFDDHPVLSWGIIAATALPAIVILLL